MNTGSQKLHLVDKGETVQIVIPCQQRRIGTPIIKSSTTQLQVRDSAGDLLLDVPQLYSTVDASKTSWLQNDESLTMTLHKLSANERWTSLEPEEVLLMLPASHAYCPSITGLGPGMKPCITSMQTLSQHARAEPQCF